MSIDQGTPRRHALGVDFGTSNTVAVARWPDGRARSLLIDGSPLLPSAVYAEPGGTLAVGRDAIYSARLDPARFEPNPKRRIDDGLVLLGDHELPVGDLIAAVLGRVAEEWHRAVGQVSPDVTLTCPATWGATRRTLLAQAAAQAGLQNARLVAEPVAAATYFAEVLGRDVPIGSVVVVHDFGAGTFDASVVARTAEGFEVLAVDGRDDIGGLDIDAAIVDYLRTDEWRPLMEPTTVEERRAQRQLWDDVRIAKERLSRAQSADFVVPLLGTEVHLTRDELEQVARPVLAQTVRVTAGLLKWADLPPGQLAGVFLVGGSSRIPLVATLLHRELGEAPVVIEQPELVVAEGSILADAALLASGAASPGPTSELRLISANRDGGSAVRVAPAAAPAPAPTYERDSSYQLDQADTVRQANPVAQGHLPGTTGLQPAVDPWPDADHGTWVPDPDATVPTMSKSIFETPSAGVQVDNAAAATRPTSPATTRPTSPAAAASRPVSPPHLTRPMSGPPGDGPRTGRPAPPPATGKRPKRRTGGFARGLQILLSVLVMILVPLAALLLAYGYGNGESVSETVSDLIDDVSKLLGM